MSELPPHPEATNRNVSATARFLTVGVCHPSPEGGRGIDQSFAYRRHGEHCPQRRSVWVTVSRPIGGVLSTGPLRGSGWVTIHLCGQPGRIGGRTTLSLFGLAPDGVCRAGQVALAAGALLPHRFTLTCTCRPGGLRAIGGLFSVALSCGSPRLAASQHPVLRSPDLPQRGDHAAVTRSTHRH